MDSQANLCGERSLIELGLYLQEAFFPFLSVLDVSGLFGLACYGVLSDHIRSNVRFCLGVVNEDPNILSGDFRP